MGPECGKGEEGFVVSPVVEVRVVHLAHIKWDPGRELVLAPPSDPH